MTATTIDTHPDPKVATRIAIRREMTSGWAERLVTDDTNATFHELVGRAFVGLGLSALYGLALGARQGGRALALHAVGVPLGMLIVVLSGAVPLFVFLSICRAPIDGRALLSTAARGLGSAGLLLAGLAPAAALFVVSSETPRAAVAAVLVGLVLGGGMALGRATLEVLRLSLRGQAVSFLGGSAVAIGFAAFSVAMAIRVWSAVLPILGGAS